MKRSVKFSLILLVVVLIIGSGFFEILADVFASNDPSVRLDLVPPTEVPGYAAGLQVGGGNLTTLVVLITNYVLGFLGLVAITAIIYAGILYVANFGNDEMAGKAKTIITYVAMGILVIILSYAIVNTLVGVVGGGGGAGPGSSPGRISGSDESVVSLESLFDIEGKDFIFPVITSLKELGDLCPNTPIGLFVNNNGCAQNELIPDTDSDGIANVLDTDDDNDGIADEEDADDDGDGVCDGDQRDASCRGGPDFCPDTASFVTFKVLNLESRKIQVDRVNEPQYLEYISQNNGCAEYQKKTDLDGDGVVDLEDCDADGDGLVDTESCSQAFFNAYPVGDPDNANITPETSFKGIVVLNVIREDIDDDDDNDGVIDFGALLQPEARELLLRQLANNFNALEGFIRRACATLPQTRKVLDYCGYDPQGQPFGKLVRMLDTLSSDLNFTDFETFNNLYQEFLAIAKAFPRVQAVINASQFEGFLPTDSSPLRVSFDALATVDPYQEFCSADDKNYYWFVNKNLDFRQGLAAVLNSATNAPTATGVFFNYDFPQPGIYNVQLLVKSACKYNIVNPGAAEGADVDGAIAGLASARISVYPPRARLVVKVDGQPDRGPQPVRILAVPQTPISFDVRESVTSRGNFEYLNYDCGTGGNQTIQGNQTNWQFSCTYPDATGTKVVRLKARDAEGDVDRTISLQFSDVISFIDVSPGLRGTTSTTFTFDGSRSKSSQRIVNYTFIIQQKRGTSYAEVTRLQQQTATYQFPSPGEYKVILEVSTGGGANQISSDAIDIVIDEQPPIAAFRITYPETIRPARALFDGSLSFHPDFPNNTAVLNYTWEVDGVTLQPRTGNASGPFTFEQQTAGSNQKVFYEFQTVGEHQVALTVTKGDQSDKVVDSTKVTTLLGVDFDVDKPGSRVGELVTFTPESDKAIGYFWDFGDGATQVGDDQPIVHKYDRQGIYSVTLTVEDGSGNTNELVKKVRVGLQNAPVAVVEVFVNNIEQNLNNVDCVEVSRNDNVIFDASKSVNIRGETNGISYLWEIDDFDEVVQTRTFSRIFKDLTKGGCIDVDLTVTDLSTNAVDQPDTISVEVINRKPELTDVRFSVNEQELVTPVTVNVSAVGARDLDGRVMRYRWWYYEEGQGQKKLDLRITDLPRTTFVIGPNNVEGTETTYYFVVEIEDNDGGLTTSLDDIGPSKPLVVTNGPNVAPVAEFVTDRSTVQTNETIAFTSTTKDPLGEFIPSAAYQWDFEGDGEFERGVSGAKVTHRYALPGMYDATLKVTKNGLSSQYQMKIRVLASTQKPEAAFIYIPSGARVKFVSNSAVDPALENKDLRHAWDFDTTVDTDGNGIPDDDADSALLSPEYEFAGDKDVFVGLRVTDSVGNSDQVVRKIPFLKTDQERGPLGATRVVPLKPVLTTNPPQNQIDHRVYLTPPYSDLIFNAQQSTGKIQEYRIDTNIFVDTDGDTIPDNDIDNKTHKSWKDGTSFKASYRQSDGDIRAKLTLVDLEGRQKSQVVDITFAEPPKTDLNRLETPDQILALFQNVPVIAFDVSTPFVQPNQEVSFDASKTKFPDEKVKEFRWDFDGDGLVDEISFEPTITHQYAEAGVYEVILEAVSDRGLQGEYSQTVFVRGGLALPVADFTYDLKDNELVIANTSTLDPSFDPLAVQYQWTFSRLDLRTAVEWTSWEQVEEYHVGQREFNLPPLWVTEDIVLDADAQANGVLSRQVVLGADEFVARFAEGTTLLTPEVQPFVGQLQFVPATSTQSVPGEQTAFVYQTGLDQVLTLSDDVRLIFNGVIQQPKLYQLAAEGDPVLLGMGVVENNLTTFALKSFGGQYLVTGTIESASTSGGQLLGVSTVKDPVKVFTDAGLYQVTLDVTDPVGEKSQKIELITIDENLHVVPPGTVTTGAEPEPVTGGEPIIPEPVIVTDQGGGFSYWWLFFVILLIIVIGAVVYIVVQTIRRRQEELEAQRPSAPAASAEAQKPIEPEVVEAKPKTPDVETSQVAPAVAEKSEKKDDNDQEPPSPPKPTGPIPDWLKG